VPRCSHLQRLLVGRLMRGHATGRTDNPLQGSSAWNAHIAEWVRLTEERELISAQVAPKLKTDINPKGAGRPESGIRAAYVKLLCERKAGALLLEVPRVQNRKQGGEGISAMLAEIGIAESTARRWQYLAQWTYPLPAYC
jgi:hypothetical protein